MVKGNKDLQSTIGHIVVQIVSADQYRDVDVAVGVGNLFATPFEQVKRGGRRSVKGLVLGNIGCRFVLVKETLTSFPQTLFSK